MNKEEFTIGPIKLIKDEDGYGIAYLSEDGKTWEVTSTFKYLDEFMLFLSHYLSNVLQHEETSQIINSKLEQLKNIDKSDEPT